MRKPKTEILRGKLRRMHESDSIHPEMPEDVAEAFLAELQFDPDCGARNARNWRPDHRNEEPWIKDVIEYNRRIQREARPVRLSPDSGKSSDEPVN